MTRQATSFGALLASHRARTGLSQLALSGNAGVSARHLSFLESGRSRPSAPMVRLLAGVLGLDHARRDELLLAAGYAPEARLHPPTCGPQAIGTQAFSAAVAISTAETAERAVEIAAAPLSWLGLEHFISGVIKRSGSRFVVERDLAGRPAVGWLRYMDLRNYHDRDHLPGAAFARCRGFFWDEARRDEMRPDQRRLLDEAEDFRIRTGFVLPIHRPDGTVRAFSSWAEAVDPDPATRTAATLIATGLMEALDRFGARSGVRTPSRLKPEHREVLLRIADGHSLEDPSSFDLVAQATWVMGSRSPVVASSRAVALGLLD